MLPEHELSNIASWKAVLSFIAGRPENPRTASWKELARKLFSESINVGLDRYFRAGLSDRQLIFSTLDHSLRGEPLRREPHVTVDLHPENVIRIAYATTPMGFSLPQIAYSLPFDKGFVTFRRFLNQLWIETMTDALPDELRGFSAPVLTRNAE
jgi:hypothetical protein